MENGIQKFNQTINWLINNHFLLQKFPGKGGWTYASIPTIEQNKNTPFGWVQVSGYIDNFEINHYKLMPMGNGTLFLPIKSAIRKSIKKEAGDIVHVRLIIENKRFETPLEIWECLREEPIALANYNSLTEGQQKEYIDWIYNTKKIETKINRIASMINKVSKGKTLKG